MVGHFKCADVDREKGKGMGGRQTIYENVPPRISKIES
jgi:hypothetical protein